MVSLQRVPEEGQEREAGTEWDAVDEALLPEEALSQLQQAVRVRAALERLDERCRRLLMLLFAGDNERPAYDEVSRRMDMPVGSIGPTRARCLAKLRPWLD
jgi:DNA-directed RNA polymerase specialized sigma24 family protein